MNLSGISMQHTPATLWTSASSSAHQRMGVSHVHRGLAGMCQTKSTCDKVLFPKSWHVLTPGNREVASCGADVQIWENVLGTARDTIKEAFDRSSILSPALQQPWAYSHKNKASCSRCYGPHGSQHPVVNWDHIKIKKNNETNMFCNPELF